MPDADTDVHDLPEVSNTDRMHELDRACWCFPEIVEPEFDGDDTHLIHHDVTRIGESTEADSPMPDQGSPRSVCEVPKVSTWRKRPWRGGSNGHD